jgi:hypothetical protein
MKLLLKIYGSAKLVGSLYLFYASWNYYFGLIERFQEFGTLDVIIIPAVFLIGLIFCFYLFFSGLADLQNKDIASRKLFWGGLFAGLLISSALFLKGGTRHLIEATCILVSTFYELFSLIKRPKQPH